MFFGKKLHRLISFFLSFSLLFQSFAPAIVYAQEATQSAETSTEIPSPTPPEPTPTEIVTPTPTEEITPTPTPTEELTPAPSPTPAAPLTPALTPTPTIEATVTPDATPSPEPTLEPTQAINETSPPAESTPTDAPTPTETVTPTPTPEPTPAITETTSLLSQVFTDKLDYAPTDTVTVNGTNFAPFQTYNIIIDSSDYPGVSYFDTVFTDGAGSFTYQRQLDGNYRPNYSVEIRDAAGTVLASTTFTDTGAPSSANLNQCGNGQVSSPEQCTGANWVNGNVNSSKAHYLEDDSVPYRLLLDNISTGSAVHTVTIEWDTTKGGKHALDYLTSYNQTESSGNNPCSDVAGCSLASFTTFAIPVDSNVTKGQDGIIGNSDDITQIAGLFTMFGGTITSVSGYSLSETYAGDSSTSVTISFTSSTATPVLAWGGHIATRTDWGQTNSAISISGSPYHTSLIEIDGSGGRQDRSLSADAVIFPGIVTIVKDAIPDSSQDFIFTTTGLTNFSLDDDLDSTLSNTKVFSISDFPSTGGDNAQNGSVQKTITESATPGWSLTDLVCNDSDGSVDLGTRTATLNVSEGENITCTFTNSLQNGTLIVKKHVENDNGGTISAGAFNLHVKSNGVDVANSPAAGSEDGTNYFLNAGTYTVSEDAPSSDYTQTGIICDGQTTDTVTLGVGETKTCIITNDDVAPKLTLVKSVTKNNGGTAGVNDFGLTIGGVSVTSGEIKTLLANTPYAINEAGLTGYTFVSITGNAKCPTNLGGTINLAPGDDITCTITNDDNPATLIVKKHVNNDYGGTRLAPSFTMNVTGTNVSNSSFPGSEEGTTITLNAVSYSVDEGSHDGYTKTLSADCSGTITLGETKNCTITNDDQPGHLIVTKVTDPTDTQTLFPITISGTGSMEAPLTRDVKDGQPVDYQVNVGTYSVSEAVPNGWSQTGNNCSQISVGLGETKNCTITNTKKGHLIVQKTTYPASHLAQFGITATGDGTITGGGSGTITDAIDKDFEVTPGTYFVTEAPTTGWKELINNCQGINISAGQTQYCSIVNEKYGAISGYKYEVEADRSFIRSLTGWTVTLSQGTTVLGSYTTESDGYFFFEKLLHGNYSLTESGPDSYTNIYSPSAITLEPDQNSINNNFGNFKNIYVEACKKVDVDGNLNTLNDQSYKFGWTVNLLTDGQVSDTKTTGENGCYRWSDIEPNHTYGVSEMVPATGWTALTATSHDFGIPMSGQNQSYTFVNFDNGHISGHKFNDLNGNGDWDKNTQDDIPDEPAIKGWKIYLDRPNDQSDIYISTSDSGYYNFSNLGPGSYRVYEEQKSGWTQTKPQGDYVINMIGNGDFDDYDFGNQGRASYSFTKHIVNGQADESTWDFTVTGPNGYSKNYLQVGNNETRSGTDVPAGTYTLTENTSGDYNTNIDCGVLGSSENGTIDLTLDASDSVSCDVTNTRKTGTITLIKQIDPTDDSGTFNLLIDGTIYAENVGEGGTTNEVTVNTGNHDISELASEGTSLSDYDTSISCDNDASDIGTDLEFAVSEGDNVICTFTNTKHGSIRIIKDADPNSDQVFGFSTDISEDGTFELIDNGNDDSDNTILFSDLNSGRYTITEDLTPGWDLSSVICEGSHEEGYSVDDRELTIDLNPGEDVTCTFANDDQPGTLIVKKVIVGSQDPASSFSFVVDDGGAQIFEGDGENKLTVDAGMYDITETDAPGFLTSYENCENINIANGGSATCTITNTAVDPKLTLTKSNNASSDRTPGGSVIFTLTLSVFDNDVSGAKVIDLPAKGFKYSLGSWLALSNFRGLISIPEPLYQSPGTWDLDNLQQGEIITLSYIADIDSTQTPGLYNDLAWANGQGIGGPVTAVGSDGAFVGTQVNVVKNTQDTPTREVEQKVEGQVLGATTTLPATGADTRWLYLALILGLLGTTSASAGIILKRKHD